MLLFIQYSSTGQQWYGIGNIRRKESGKDTQFS